MTAASSHPHPDRRLPPGRTATEATEVSIELFPPRSPDGAARLEQVVERLGRLQPAYVSVTCGASGNPAEGTAPLVDQLRARGLDGVPHLTCASTTRDEVHAIARSYRERGIGKIVALRGDRPKTGAIDPATQYLYATDLVAALTQIGGFEIAVAAYPEPHPEAPSAEADLANLKRKVDAGAAQAITQYCFETDTILRFRDRMVRAGIDVPLSVGVLPINDFDQMRRFSRRCGAGVPAWLSERFEAVRADPAGTTEVAVDVAAEQAQTLIANDLPRLHFYCLNRATLTIAICKRLGHQPALQAAA
jgi:methylenetetrahydrofolate reductase (NADPH)